MTCSSFGMLLEQIGRNSLVDARLRTVALEHAQGCPRCRIQLANERMLSAGLSVLASELAGQGPSRSVESAVMSAYGQHFSQQRNRFGWVASGLVAIAACLTVAVLVRVQQAPRPGQPAKITYLDQAAGDTVVSLAEAAFGDASKGRFVKIPFAEQLGPEERAELENVRMPRGALAAMGVPGLDAPVLSAGMGAADPEEQVSAEVVVGEDRVPRAVRVSNQPETLW